MPARVRIRVNSPKVVGEVIDGEAVIVNLDNGNYYSMDGPGGEIWSFIEQNMTVEAIIEATSQKYEGERTEIDAQVRELVAGLQHEGLVILDDVEDAETKDDEAAIPMAGAKTAFARPVLHKYEDMQDLLLLDPIHEVDEMGWPNVKPPGNESA